MPYIDQERADELREDYGYADTPEELAFAFCDIIDCYLYRNGVHARQIIESLGALDETRAELLRRVGDPHEWRAQGNTDAVDPFEFSAPSLY